MSAAASQPARMTQARHACLRDQTLATTTAAATIRDSQASAAGGAEYAYSASAEGSHCHGPPIAPVANVSLNRSEAKVYVPLAVPGIPGCADEVRSDTTSTAPYPASTASCSAQHRQ